MPNRYESMNLSSNAINTDIDRAAYSSGFDKPINQAHYRMFSDV